MTKEDLELWYENNRDGMLRYAMSLVHNSVDIGCDLVSDANIVMMEKYGNIQTEEEYRKLLCRIILNKAMNLRRTKKEINLDDPLENIPDKDQIDDTNVIKIDIKTAIEQLPQIDKEAIKVSLGYAPKPENVTQEAQSKRAERARAKLKKYLTHY